jgi:CxxC motif-containing protein (DUF1111 family)
MRRALAALLCLAATPVLADELDVATGKALFDRKWVQAPASTDSADGLGPLFNASACSTCHKDGRGARFTTVGGVLGVAGFVVRLGDEYGRPDPHFGKQIQERAIPGLEPEARIAPALETTESGLARMTASVAFNGGEPAAATHQQILVAPSLVGRGLIGDVAMEAVLARADPGDRNGDGISGRARLLDDGRTLGRFGTKATGRSIAEQAADAAAFDMGLSSPLRPFPYGDCTPQQQRCLNQANGRSPDFDNEEISAAIINAVATYVASLDHKAPASNPSGEQLFAATGCAQCHVPLMPSKTGKMLPVFSDLLLHDLGNGLAGAFGDMEFSAREWRTAPLIDMDDRQGKRRYLHDGRAATIADAVRWHDGEARQARDRFLALGEDERQRLLDYVGSL